MNTLNQESKVENITLAGMLEGANVRMTYARENEKTVRQITVHADKPQDGGTPVSLYMEYNPAGRNVIINVYNTTLDAVPLALIERALAEMQAVNGATENQPPVV